MAAAMPSTAKPALVAVLAASARAFVNAAGIIVRSTWKAWRNRREVERLLHLDDHGLADIGLKRGDVTAALAGPLIDDPSTRLRVWAVERRAARRAQLLDWRAEIEASAQTHRTPV